MFLTGELIDVGSMGAAAVCCLFVSKSCLETTSHAKSYLVNYAFKSTNVLI